MSSLPDSAKSAWKESRRIGVRLVAIAAVFCGANGVFPAVPFALGAAINPGGCGLVAGALLMYASSILGLVFGSIAVWRGDRLDRVLGAAAIVLFLAALVIFFAPFFSNSI